MSKDAMIFNGCDHVVNNNKYEANDCPLCLGRNYYQDITFNSSGYAITCTSEIKLQQEVLKIISDPKGGNVFHKEWGDLLATNSASSIVGTKNVQVMSQKIKVIVFETLQYLKGVQMNNQALFKNMSSSEIIDQIVSIEISALGPMGYTINCTFSNGVGEIFTQQIMI